MGIAEDLLRQADHLATYEGPNPCQASLRRAVSTAYYALFHLLVEAAALRWNGSPEAQTGMQRGFQHGAMSKISSQFQKQSLIFEFAAPRGEIRTQADADGPEGWPCPEADTPGRRLAIRRRHSRWQPRHRV